MARISWVALGRHDFIPHQLTQDSGSIFILLIFVLPDQEGHVLEYFNHEGFCHELQI